MRTEVEAVGCHVFAGAFTAGMKKVYDVAAQLETHGFALDTARDVVGVHVQNSDPKDWPQLKGKVLFGNPRCSGFSTTTAGYDESSHGSWCKQTEDIHQIMEYATGHFDIVIWESVQQAMKTGRELLDYLRDKYAIPNGYRIAHVKLNAASFDNAQNRKRYFFVMYRESLGPFNVDAPKITPFYYTLYDEIYKDKDRETFAYIPRHHGIEYGPDHYVQLTDTEMQAIPAIPNGWCLNATARYPIARSGLPKIMQDKWELRNSDMPFSLHCIRRLSWMRPCPTIASSSTRFIHPELERPLTVGELAKCMGWDFGIPVGKAPVAQIGKGVIPKLATWLAEQCEACFNKKWGSDDWEVKYNHHKSIWEGGDATGQVEKTLDLTQYYGRHFDVERYPDAVRRPSHIVDVSLNDLRRRDRHLPNFERR